MAFSFQKKDEKKKGLGASLDDKEMAKRLEQEAARYKDATDSEMWSCLCFKAQEDKERFLELTRIPDRRFVTGEELREGTEAFKPKTKRRGFPRKPKTMVSTPNPLKDVNYNQSLEQASIDEAMALKEAMLAVQRPEPCGEATDSDIWICAVFKNREDSEEYLTEWNLHKYGDKYLDASAWLKEIEAM